MRKKKKIRLIKEERIALEYLKRKYGKKAFKEDGSIKLQYLEKAIDHLMDENKKRGKLLDALIFTRFKLRNHKK